MRRHLLWVLAIIHSPLVGTGEWPLPTGRDQRVATPHWWGLETILRKRGGSIAVGAIAVALNRDPC